jgi:membrane protease YdiL (CAAX protease family)
MSRGDFPVLRTHSQTGMSPATKADIASNIIEKGEAVELFQKQFPVFVTLPKLLALPNETEAKDDLRHFFDGLSLKERTRLEIIERESILDHTLNQHLAKTFDKSDDEPDTTHEKLITILDNLDSPSAGIQLSEDAQTIERLLPNNFFRYQLLKSIYENGKEHELLSSLNVSHQLQVDMRMKRMIAGILFSIICCLGGIAALAIFIKILVSKPASQFENLLYGCTLKQVYCVGLALNVICTLMTIPVVVVMTTAPSPAEFLKNFAAEVSFAQSAVTLGILLSCTTFIVCNPLKVNIFDVLRQLFTGNWMRSLITAIGAFCMLKVLAVLYYYVVSLLFHTAPEFNNPIDEQIANLVIYPNGVNAVLLWLYAAILAPFTEEFAFRGLLYTALRKKVGFYYATLISAIIFAAIHLDLNSFIPILAIGIVLAVIFERTKSLQACFLLHLLWNTSFLVESCLLK